MSHSNTRTTLAHGASSSPAPVTIFAMPKAFRGHAALIQGNAIGSWLRLSPRPEIILFGNDPGTAEVAAEHGLVHVPDVRRNEHGTPLMDDMFRAAHGRASHELLAYVNADIVLVSDFSHAANRLATMFAGAFLMIGRRTDVNVFEALDFDAPDWEDRVQDLARRTGAYAPRMCKDYFLFRKPLLSDIPPFAIGRAVYDNWFVHDVKRRGLPVIDATDVVTAIHQNHGYGHVAGGDRGHAYIRGSESRRNTQLAGGKHLVSGSTTTWRLTPDGLRRRAFPSDWPQFLADLPRAFKLVLELYGWTEPSFTKAERSRRIAA